MRLMRRLTTARAAQIILALLLLAMAARPALDPDMFWHIRLGQQSIESGEFVYLDSFSHTRAGALHKNHSWLAQVVMARLWQLGGHLGLTLYVAALAMGGMLLLYRAGRGNVYLRAFVLVLGAACAAAFWSPRPQMFTFILACFLLLMLRRWQHGEGASLWRLPLLMWLWSNLHGGFVVGYLFIGAYIVGACLDSVSGGRRARTGWLPLKKLCGWTLVSLALLPIHPLGLDVFSAPLDTLGAANMRELITEWQSPDFSQPQTWPLVMLLIALIGASKASGRRLNFSELLLLGGTLFMALVSARHISLFAIAAVPVVCADLDAVLNRNGWQIPRRCLEAPFRAAINLALVCLVALGTLAHVAFVSRGETLERTLAQNYPVGAVEFLQSASPQGKLFNSYNWGGYLLLELPEYAVFIDGRADLYGDLLSEYAVAAYGAPGWAEVLREHDIEIALIETGGPLAWRLDEDPRWRSVYQDDLASVYKLTEAEA